MYRYFGRLMYRYVDGRQREGRQLLMVDNTYVERTIIRFMDKYVDR